MKYLRFELAVMAAIFRAIQSVGTSPLARGLRMSANNANHRRNLVRLGACITVLPNEALFNNNSIEDPTGSAPQRKSRHQSVRTHVF